MKVMLLSLPGLTERDGNFFPLGIGYIVTALKPLHDARAFHYNHMKDARREIPAIIGAFQPDVVGLSCTSFNRGFVREIIRLVKGIDSSVRVVVGGVHASFCSGQVLTEYGADVVVVGEGEFTMLELCNAIEGGASLKSVKGIVYMDGNEVVHNPPRPTVRDLDEFPMPDHTHARSFIKDLGMGLLITSRGCPVRCTFCSTSSFWGQKIRMNSPARVVDEMEMLVSRFKVKRIFFHDDTFNLGIPRVNAICDEIMKRGLKVDWACSCRVMPVTEEMLGRMVEAGCRHICWGVESGSADILKSIDKKISLEQIRRAFELSAGFSGLMATGSFTMVGNPGESERTIRETVDFLNTLPMTDAPNTAVLYVLPGTLLYENLKSKGLIDDEDWHRYYTIPFYTLENSFLRMLRWSRMVSRSGKRTPFDPDRHFWRKTVLETAGRGPGMKKRIISAANSIETWLTQPQRAVSAIKKCLPAGRIRF